MPWHLDYMFSFNNGCLGMKYISRIPDECNALLFPRRLAIMGSTGSIGNSALRVLEAWKASGKFHVQALAAGRNIARLAEQACIWRPPYLAILEKEGPHGIDALYRLLPSGYHPEILSGPKGFASLASLDCVDMVLSAQVGAAGLRATAVAAATGKTICLANKESLILAGELIRTLCVHTGAVIFPVDSEHCALFECMLGHRKQDIAKLVLTASGGPFRTSSAASLAHVSPEDALRHPSWSMGSKITIDSATLMNKGMEIIEACHLYGMHVDDVTVVVHPQSIVHSLVELSDGSMIGQLAMPDMRISIAASLSWPYLLDGRITGIKPLNLAAIGSLTFEEPRTDIFPCLNLARKAFAEGHTVELNAANEVAVARFLAGDISFMDIPALVGDILKHSGESVKIPNCCGADILGQTLVALNAIEHIDASARARAADWRTD